MNLKLILFVGVCAIGFAMSSNAGTIADVDGDSIPDVFDDCSAVANGQAETPNNQFDSDIDGYGNSCDADYNNDGLVSGLDFLEFSAFFGGLDQEADHNVDGLVSGLDFLIFSALFGQPIGPSGLNCAGTVPCP